MNEHQQPQQNSRIYTGLFLLAAGGLIFANRMGIELPDWIFSVGTLLIGIGILISLKSGFQNPGGYILLLIGSIFLLDEFIPSMNIEKYTFPIILMSIGAVFILRPKNSLRRNRWNKNTGYTDSTNVFGNNPSGINNDNSEYLDSVSVFGGVKKNILSKNFKGGEITCFMGGAELNLTQADIQGTIVLEVTNVFGGTKLVVPANWYIQNEVTAIFGGVDDKRPVTPILPDANKTLLIKGTCIFGGIEIKNY